MPDRNKPRVEQRRSPRVRHSLPVVYRTISGFLTDWTTNISRGGLFLRTEEPLPVGTRVKLLLSLPDMPAPFELMAQVVRVHEPGRGNGEERGMGLEFVDVGEEKQAQLEHFVEKLRQQTPEELPGRPRK
jgi:type IV pilus assembly protein PilZ